MPIEESEWRLSKVLVRMFCVEAFALARLKHVGQDHEAALGGEQQQLRV